MRRRLAVVGFLFATASYAEEPTPPPAPPRLADARMEEFYARFITYDEDLRIGYLGRERKRLTPEEMYTVLGRDDLVAGVAQRRSSRVLFYFAGAGVAAISIAVASYLWASVPDPNSPRCVTDGASYGACIDELHAREITGTAVVAGGVLLGALTAAWGYRRNLEPVTAEEALKMVNDYNLALLHKAKSPGAGVWRSLHFGLALAPGGARVGLSAAF